MSVGLYKWCGVHLSVWWNVQMYICISLYWRCPRYRRCWPYTPELAVLGAVRLDEGAGPRCTHQA